MRIINMAVAVSLTAATLAGTAPAQAHKNDAGAFIGGLVAGAVLGGAAAAASQPRPYPYYGAPPPRYYQPPPRYYAPPPPPYGYPPYCGYAPYPPCYR